MTRSASPAEIKKAYRRLALQLHPDKNRGDLEAEKRFKEVNAAHALLSDRKRRAVYDQFGSEAASVFGSADGGAGGEGPPPGAVAAVGGCLALVALVLLISQVAMVTSKIDRPPGVSWAAVAWPVWFVDIIEVLFLVAAAFKFRSLAVFAYLAVVLCNVLFHVLLVLKLDGRSGLSPRQVIAPLLACEVVNTIIAILEINPEAYDERYAGRFKRYIGGYFGFALLRLLVPVMRTIVEVAILLKIEGQLRAAWAAILMPIPVVFLLARAISFINDLRTVEAGAEAGYIPSAEVPGEISAARSTFAASLSVFIFLVIQLGLIAAKLDGALAVKLAAILTPFWIFASISVCLIPLLAFSLASSLPPDHDDGTQVNPDDLEAGRNQHQNNMKYNDPNYDPDADVHGGAPTPTPFASDMEGAPLLREDK